MSSTAVTLLIAGAANLLPALFFMFKDGLDANTPIYYSLAIGLVSFVVVSVLSRKTVGAVKLA